MALLMPGWEQQQAAAQAQGQGQGQQEPAAGGEASAAAADAAAGGGAAASGGGGGGRPFVRDTWVRVFTEEYQGRAGYFTRRFLAASYASAWRRICCQPAGQRHLYEVIWEKRPCHLYFDIEYCRCVWGGAGGHEGHGLDACFSAHVGRPALLQLPAMLTSYWRRKPPPTTTCTDLT